MRIALALRGTGTFPKINPPVQTPGTASARADGNEHFQFRGAVRAKRGAPLSRCVPAVRHYGTRTPALRDPSPSEGTQLVSTVVVGAAARFNNGCLTMGCTFRASECCPKPRNGKAYLRNVFFQQCRSATLIPGVAASSPRSRRRFVSRSAP
jgi:hypothetical protein